MVTVPIIIIGAEMTTMSKWFDEVGYSADVETLRRRFPEMLTLEQYFSQAVAE